MKLLPLLAVALVGCTQPSTVPSTSDSTQDAGHPYDPDGVAGPSSKWLDPIDEPYADTSTHYINCETGKVAPHTADISKEGEPLKIDEETWADPTPEQEAHAERECPED